MFKKGIMSLESIDFQDNSFLQDLTKAINKLRYLDHGLSNTKFFNSVELGGIISCIKKHTNLSVTFQPTEFGAAVYTPQISNNNVLVNNDTKDLFKAFDLNQEESI